MPQRSANQDVTGNGGPAAPDLLGDAGRAEMAAKMLLGLQTQRQELFLMQLVNKAEDGETVPNQDGRPMLDRDGQPISYRQRRESLEEAERAVMAAHRDLTGEIAAMAKAPG
jgi:hypothetical protein